MNVVSVFLLHLLLVVQQKVASFWKRVAADQPADPVIAYHFTLPYVLTVQRLFVYLVISISV